MPWLDHEARDTQEQRSLAPSIAANRTHGRNQQDEKARHRCRRSCRWRALPAGAQTQTKPLDRANLDTTCAPCTNFYQFANGGWLKRNPIPAAYSGWGSFNELADRNNENFDKILEEAAAARTTSR